MQEVYHRDNLLASKSSAGYTVLFQAQRERGSASQVGAVLLADLLQLKLGNQGGPP